MDIALENHRIITEEDDYIPVWIEHFLIDRRAQGITRGTREFYGVKLKAFLKYCDSQIITNISQITPQSIRDYLIFLEDTGHNHGGIHCHYRTLKTFLRFYWNEVEPPLRNPIEKVKAPRVETEIIEGVNKDIFEKLLAVTETKRDCALLCFMFDTGCRASEVIHLEKNDVNLVSGAVVIRHSKSKKPRIVFLGRRSRLALRKYLREENHGLFLFQSRYKAPLTYWGLREILRRLSEKASLEMSSPHDFRRGFALAMLRNGADVFSLQSLMGHSDLQVLRRYLKQTDEDLHFAHMKGSPVDKGEEY
jgi:site-specific recombinase XerD